MKTSGTIEIDVVSPSRKVITEMMMINMVTRKEISDLNGFSKDVLLNSLALYLLSLVFIKKQTDFVASR